MHRHRHRHRHRWSASSCCCTGDTDGGPFLPSPSQPADLRPPSSPLPAIASDGRLFQQPPSNQQVIPAPPLIRRALSTGDLVDKPAPVGRYSAEERRERIDKYRSKRNQRNFQKKITYACRKTLADSRPRVKGRFARNAGDTYLLQAEELTQTGVVSLRVDDAAAATAAGHPGCEPNTMMVMMNPAPAPAPAPAVFPGGDANTSLVAHAGTGSSSGTTTAVPEWWPAMQEPLPREEEDLLAAYLGVSSINLYSYSPRGR